MFSMHQYRLYVVLLAASVLFMYILFQYDSRLHELEREQQQLHALIRSQQNKLDNLDRDNFVGDPYLSSLPIASKIVRNEPEGINNSTIIIYNRVPKTGSTSFMGIAYDLCSDNHFNVIHINTSKNSHLLSLPDQLEFIRNVTNWHQRQPALYHGHISYIDFNRFGVKKTPIFINIIREPLDRLISYYYFLRYGDDFRPFLVRKRQGDKVTFDECVEQDGRDCNVNLMWLQIPFFCGQHSQCWQVGSDWALAEAKRNLVNNYLVVGLTEQLDDFIMVLEAILPQFFRNATNLFKSGSKSHLRRTISKIQPSLDVVERIHKTPVWKMENEFYQFAKRQFEFTKSRIVKNKNLPLIPGRGRQFFFEKIRPR